MVNSTSYTKAIVGNKALYNNKVPPEVNYKDVEKILNTTNMLEFCVFLLFKNLYLDYPICVEINHMTITTDIQNIIIQYFYYVQSVLIIL